MPNGLPTAGALLLLGGMDFAPAAAEPSGLPAERVCADLCKKIAASAVFCRPLICHTLTSIRRCGAASVRESTLRVVSGLWHRANSVDADQTVSEHEDHKQDDNDEWHAQHPKYSTFKH